MKDKAKTKREAFEYKSRPKEKWKEKANEGSGNFDRYVVDNVSTFKARDGLNRIRVLPPSWKNPDDFAYTLQVHYGVGPDEQTYLCPKMKGESCPICAESSALQKAGETEDAKSLRSRKRSAVWIIDRKAEDEGLQFWPMPFGVHRDACLAAEDEDGEILEFDHPEEGYDLIFHKEGIGKRTKYTGLKLSRKPTPLSEDEDQMQKWLKYIQDHPIPNLLKFYDADYIGEVFAGNRSSKEETKDEDLDSDVDADKDEDEEDETPRKKSKSKSKSDEDEDEEADEDDEDEEVEVSKKSKKRPIDDELEPTDDEDEEKDEEEEEVVVKTSSKKKSKSKDKVEDEDVDEAEERITSKKVGKKSIEPKTGSSSGISETSKITLLVKANPRREGTKAHKRFALYKTGMTVGDYLKKGGSRGSLRKDLKLKRVKVT